MYLVPYQSGLIALSVSFDIIYHFTKSRVMPRFT